MSKLFLISHTNGYLPFIGGDLFIYTDHRRTMIGIMIEKMSTCEHYLKISQKNLKDNGI